MSTEIIQKEQVIDKETLLRALPSGKAKLVTDDLVQTINDLKCDESFVEHYRENLLGYTSVLTQGKYPLHKYVDAVRYVSYYLLNYGQIRSYELTFPDRYNRLVQQEGADDKKVSAYASAYHNGQLVTQILTQAQVPISILNADKFQMAVNVQASLMVNSKSDMVRMQAANSLMTHLKPPEETKLSIDVNNGDTDAIADLRATVHQMSQLQRDMITGGARSAKQIADADLVVIEHTED